LIKNLITWILGLWLVLGRHRIQLPIVLGIGVTAVLTIAVFFRPRLAVLECFTGDVLQLPDGTGYAQLAGNVALIATFKNVSRWWRAALPPNDRVSAQIDFLNDDLAIFEQSHSASWIDSTSPTVCFGVGQTRKLIIAIKDGGGFSVPEMPIPSTSASPPFKDHLEAYRHGYLLGRRTLADAPMKAWANVVLTSACLGKQETVYRIRLSHEPEIYPAERRSWPATVLRKVMPTLDRKLTKLDL
jgi:hypothetical protein